MAWRLMVVAEGKSRRLASPSTIGNPNLSAGDQASKLMAAVRFRNLAPMLKRILVVRAEHDTPNWEVTSHDGALYFFKEEPDVR